MEEQLILAKVLVVQMRVPAFYRELIRNGGLMTTVENEESEEVWVRSGVGEQYRNLDLRRFLSGTREISTPAARVRRWIRVTETGAGEDDEAPDDLDERSSVMRAALDR